MPLRANCPDCRTVLAIADQAAGKRVLCPKCRTEFPAPVAEDPKPLEHIAATLAAAPALSGSHAEAEPTLVEPAETT